MADISEALERLVTDPGFLGQLRTDPAAALGGYRLNQADLDVLTSQFNDAADAQHGVEQRTSKSAILGVLSSFSDAAGGGSAPADLAAAGDPDEVDKASPTLSIACCTGTLDPEDHDLVLAAVDDSEPASREGDPDRPVIVGAVPNTADEGAEAPAAADLGSWHKAEGLNWDP